MCTVHKLGNILEELRQLFVLCRKQALPVYHGNCDRYRMFDNIHRRLQLLCPKELMPPTAAVTNSSWYDTVDASRRWHIDNSGDTATLICGYPTSTEIFDATSEVRFDVLAARHQFAVCSVSQQTRLLRGYVLSGRARIFQPDPGDVYYLGPGVIHRSPKTRRGVFRLVGRVWIEHAGE